MEDVRPKGSVASLFEAARPERSAALAFEAGRKASTASILKRPCPGSCKNWVMGAVRGHGSGCKRYLAWLRSKVCSVVSFTKRPCSGSS